MRLELADYLIILVYFIFVIGVGFLIKKKIKSSNDFLTSSRSIPLWITSLAFISANLGAQEVIGMVASGAKYGIMTVHFYWVGAIFAMVFLGVFMMPFYYGSRARSVPEYLSLRFDEKTRGLNAISFAVMTVFSSGISLYALAKLMETILHWDFDISIWVSAGIVMVYTFLGGLTSAVYNEVSTVLSNCAGSFASGNNFVARCRWVGQYKSIVTTRNDTCLEIHGQCQRQPDGVTFYVADIRIGFCNVVRLLVYRFSGSTTSHDCPKHGRCATHTYNCSYS